jgi:mutator protein MutT
MSIFEPKKTISVAVALIFREENHRHQLLIALRRAESHLGGLWELPGGKIEAGESAADAVVREVAEEVGLEVEAMGSVEPFEHRYEDRTVHIQPIWCRPTGSEAAEARQVDQVRWIEPSELDQYTFPPANAGVINDLVAGLWP